MPSPNPNPPPHRTYSRRRILAWGGSGAVGAVGAYLAIRPRETTGSNGSGLKPDGLKPGGSSAEVRPSPVSSATGDLRRERFLPYLNSEFGIAMGGARCKLVEIGENVRITAPRETFVSYSLIFQAAGDLGLEGGTYRLSHPQLGDLDLFLTPVGRPDTRVHLEAVCCQRA